ncbi:MAG: proteasome assembly chaperone family protein [Euryarchaeota archaeon]|jgi:uncharacterized protein (TIGR00162 family)|nr:proteasome assembly chaperone family protein [Euryarchaeota archaeon]
MADIIRYETRPELRRPFFIEALPGIGNVGKVAGDFIADSTDAKRFATIYSEDFPPQVLLDEDSVVEMACNELWYSRVDDRDVVFLRGEHQGSTQEGQFRLARRVMDILLELDVSRIVTLGGYGLGEIVEEPRVLGAVSTKDIKQEFSGYGVVFSPNDPQAGIVGAAGLLIGFGKMHGIESICLMAETSGFFVDHKAALATVAVLTKMLGIDPDLTELRDKTDQIDALASRIKEAETQTKCDDLNYIG